MSELLPEQAMSALSPRLTWLKKHNLSLGELPDGTRFIASYGCIQIGDTHKDAELKMAEYLMVDHWEIEDFRKAGVLMPGDVVEESW